MTEKNQEFDKLEGLRILHFMSPVKWNGDTFMADADANFKVLKKTIEFLPQCHHYVITPPEINVRLDLESDNVSRLEYDYPHSVFLNRYIFDFKKIKGFEINRMDVDFVFNHQPEQTLALQVWLGTFRYYTDIKVFNFFHWIDCRKNKGGFCNVQPINFLRQYEATVVGNVNFFHNKQAVKYMKSNFKELTYMPEIKNVRYMPLSAKADGDMTPFDLPDKKIIVFNHRWNVSSGINKFLEYIEGLSDEYVIWATDEACDVKADNFIVKKLKYTDFNYLMANCYCNVTFIDGYTTWNLSAQDCILRDKPTLCFKHPTLVDVIGEDYPFYFKDKAEFKRKLKDLPDHIDHKSHIMSHDEIFKSNLVDTMKEIWQDTKTEPKNAHKYINYIKKGITDKNSILGLVNTKMKTNGSNHFIRRHIMNHGISDDFTKPYTTYYIKGDERTIKRDLFSQ